MLIRGGIDVEERIHLAAALGGVAVALRTEVAHLCSASEAIESHRSAIVGLLSGCHEGFLLVNFALLLALLLVELGVVGVWVVVAMDLRIVALVLFVLLLWLREAMRLN